MKSILIIVAVLLLVQISDAQYAPQAPLPGNDAVPATDSRIVGWATGCTVDRGWMNIADTSLGKVTNGTETDVIGPPSLQVLSLGDRGTAVVTFAEPIKDGPGPDFAVFENGFANPLNDTLAFLELAYVAVSSDGIHYITFPSECNIQDTAQFDFAYSDARLIHNLAGKYINGYGTPFDLSELVDSPDLDLQHIRYIKITDVVGSLNPQYASYDQNGHKINDPYPTPYTTGGFDLNAIGVLNQQTTAVQQPTLPAGIKLWPIPAEDFIYLQPELPDAYEFQIFNLWGKRVAEGHEKGEIRIPVQKFAPGAYFIRCQMPGASPKTLKFIKS